MLPKERLMTKELGITNLYSVEVTIEEFCPWGDFTKSFRVFGESCELANVYAYLQIQGYRNATDNRYACGFKSTVSECDFAVGTYTDSKIIYKSPFSILKTIQKNFLAGDGINKSEVIVMTRISSRAEFDVFLENSNFEGSKLSVLSKEDLMFFRQNLNFDEAGKLISAFWGDLENKYKLSLGDISKVFSLFGVSEDEFNKGQHYFGDGQGNCNPRRFFYCGR